MQDYVPLARFLQEWKATAHVYDDPEAFEALTAPLDADAVRSISD